MRRRQGRGLRGQVPTVHEALSRDCRFSLLAAFNVGGFVPEVCRIVEKRGVNTEDIVEWVRGDLCGLYEDGTFMGGVSETTGERLTIISSSI